jgi:hypothetical protein
MSYTIFRSSIWLETLDEKSTYSGEFKDDVEILRVSFKNIRKKAEVIANHINESQPGLTLHDISHLDSLWETAHTIAGKDLKLNPIEAYIFGCSILFHDLGMALVLWDENLEQLKKSNEFNDLVFDFYKRKLERNPTEKELKKIPEEISKAALFARLRDLHAFKAKELPLKSWQLKNDTIFLIESSDLRNKLGSKIGLIAESHWWNIDDIRTNFRSQIISPSPTSFPAEWTINNVKLACLLRLADFIHIDDRRAPSLQYALTKPIDVSEAHWNFQNKLNRAFTQDGRLVFESHTNFRYEDNMSWWLAYNTICDIDKEIKSVDNLFIDFNIPFFQNKGVKGIETPLLFSEYIKTEGWEPANTQFKISDFQNLIEKLGGKQLYGNRPDVPLRELIQNACDALQAKRHFVKDFKGEIIVKYYDDTNGNDCLEIIDNGIGMSKSALLYGLLDFGNSYWKRNLIRKEHPGLISSGFSPIGNFGIGFFSVFMISDFIQIITKPLNDGANTIVLEFNNGLSFNPILRKAKREEERPESGTTIRINCKEKGLINNIYKSVAELSDVIVDNPLAYSCRRIAPALSEKLTVSFKDTLPETINTGNDWTEINSLTLLKRISGFGSSEENGWNIERLKYISEFVRPIFKGENKEIIARSTIVKQLPTNNHYSGHGVVTVGGLKQSIIYRFPGVWLGNNEVVSRNYANPICTFHELKPWLEEQYNLVIESEKITESEKIELASIFYSLGFPCKKLPIANTSEGWKTYEDLVNMKHGDHVVLRFVVNEREESLKILPNIICAAMSTPVIDIDKERNSQQGLWGNDLEEIGKSKEVEYDNQLNHRSLFGFTIKAICESWGIDEKDVVKASLVSLTKWKPIMDVYQNKYGETIKEPVTIIVNPKLTNKKKIYKQYEDEIKRWIGITADQVFNIENFTD